MLCFVCCRLWLIVAGNIAGISYGSGPIGRLGTAGRQAKLPSPKMSSIRLHLSLASGHGFHPESCKRRLRSMETTDRNILVPHSDPAISWKSGMYSLPRAHDQAISHLKFPPSIGIWKERRSMAFDSTCFAHYLWKRLMVNAWYLCN
jgi:hypothetical protein